LKPKLQLNILWLDTKIGLAVDQLQSGERIPLTKYFFWPKTDAWDQIRRELDTKSWIVDSEKVELLSSTATIMNQWQSSNNNTSIPMKKKRTLDY
jgi:30S ribosomal protein 3